MSESPAIPAALARLEAAVASGQLPEATEKTAKRLLVQLGNPVRIAVLGMPESGKSQLLNFLAGDDIIPEGVKLPTLQLKEGQKLKVDCTLPDGSTRSLDQFDANEIADLAPVFLLVKTPLPALGKISLLELVVGSSPTEHTRALAWAARRSDIALWCTQVFSKAENDLWEMIPDALKNHSFLVVTKADQLASKDALAERMAEIRDAAEDSFHGILPVATLQAIAARGASGSVDKKQLVDSGGQALISAILHDVEQAHEAALLSAEILFGQRDFKEIIYEEPEVEPTAQPGASEPEVSPIIRAEPEAPEEDFYTEIVSYLATLASDLTKKLNVPTPNSSSEILAQCLECAYWLLGRLSGQASKNPNLTEAVHTCQDAIDLMVLMQMEKQDDNTVVDAVSLMLQIKRDFEVKIAA